ncbi:MAG: hypothetical protein CEO19_121 [Parcubacteria group bacterium Gr01-1014_73]|nr:MAG: hypothetical protein CEO19_121 [Parcubacteria group bacterium Gr01-1014_73]
MLIIVLVIIGLVLLSIALEVAKRNPEEHYPSLVMFLAFSAAICIWLSGTYVQSGKGKLLTSSAIVDKNLYLFGATTNVVCMIPAKLNGLTTVVESDGIPAYYTGLKMEANSGPVIAVKTKDGDIVLKPFPLKMETEKDRLERLAH